MEARSLSIEGIPAILWGPASDRLLVAVHGNQSSKSDTVIEIVAEIAVAKGYRVLSFDLPEHGDRKEEARLCDAENCTHDLAQIMRYARTLSEDISVFGCSIGAYFALLAYRDEPIRQALFLSPVVDMKRLIENMMMWFDVSAERLEKEQEVATPINTLYWHYYQYVLEHPVRWEQPTVLLYGAKDTLCEYAYVKDFAGRCGATLTVLEDGEHFFHTEKHLDCLREWLREYLESAGINNEDKYEKD